MIGELKELVTKFNGDNMVMLIALCIMVLSTATIYIQLFYASQYETVLMNKSDVFKRFFFVYIVLFFVFVVTNYFFATDDSFFLPNIIILLLTLVISFIYKLISLIEKFKEQYLKFCETRNMIILMTFTIMGIFVVNIMLDINQISLVVMGSLIEVLTIAMFILNVSKIKSFVTVTIEGEKWYVFKRIDDAYLLCGDNCMINTSTKTRLIEIDNIVKSNICFKKELQETKSQESKSQEAKSKDVKSKK